eukprot:3711328-Rhodomonas_salina.2
MSGTGCYALPGTVLRLCYARSGTEADHCAMPLQCNVRAWGGPGCYLRPRSHTLSSAPTCSASLTPSSWY